MNINLFYLSDCPYGGWVSYTLHLCESLRSIGHNCNLYRIGKQTRNPSNGFMKYDLGPEQIVNIDYARKLASESPSVLVVVGKKFVDLAIRLLDKNVTMVVHDPNELKFIPCEQAEKIIVIRSSMLRYLPHAEFIKHPYKRASLEPIPLSQRPVNAISVSRIASDKKTVLLTKANKILPKEKRIEIHGFEDRTYCQPGTSFRKINPDWEQSTRAFPRIFGCGAHLCSKSKWTVDLSMIAGDGGGTQYTFLEAIDAQSGLIINKHWLKNNITPFIHGYNCYTASDENELCRLLYRDPENRVTDNALKILDQHKPEIIAPQILEYILR